MGTVSLWDPTKRKLEGMTLLSSYFLISCWDSPWATPDWTPKWSEPIDGDNIGHFPQGGNRKEKARE